MIAVAETLLPATLTALALAAGHGLRTGHRRRVLRRHVDEYLDWLFNELEMS